MFACHGKEPPPTTPIRPSLPEKDSYVTILCPLEGETVGTDDGEGNVGSCRDGGDGSGGGGNCGIAPVSSDQGLQGTRRGDAIAKADGSPDEGNSALSSLGNKNIPQEILPAVGVLGWETSSPTTKILSTVGTSSTATAPLPKLLDFYDLSDPGSCHPEMRATREYLERHREFDLARAVLEGGLGGTRDRIATLDVPAVARYVFQVT